MSDTSLRNNGNHEFLKHALQVENLSWPTSADRDSTLFSIAKQLLSDERPAVYEAGCRLVRTTQAQLTNRQVNSIMPRLIQKLDIEIDLEALDFSMPTPAGQDGGVDAFETLDQPGVTLATLSVLGARARSALPAIRKFTQIPIPASNYTNYAIRGFLELARSAETAIKD